MYEIDNVKKNRITVDRDNAITHAQLFNNSAKWITCCIIIIIIRKQKPAGNLLCRNPAMFGLAEGPIL